jgi:hypothetical protein
MDAYLEEELYDILIYCLQNPDASDFEAKKQRVFTIGKELYADGGMDAMENMFYSIEFRIKERNWQGSQTISVVVERYIERMEILGTR